MIWKSFLAHESNDSGNELAKHTHVQDVMNSNICQPLSIQFDLPIDFYNTKFYQIMLDYYAIMHFVFPPWASFKLKINFERVRQQTWKEERAATDKWLWKFP